MIALEQQKLFDEIETLPIELKTKIVDKILSSISPANKSIDDLWIAEANRRKDEIESNPAKLVDGESVFKKIAQRLNS